MNRDRLTLDLLGQSGESDRVLFFVLFGGGDRLIHQPCRLDKRLGTEPIARVGTVAAKMNIRLQRALFQNIEVSAQKRPHSWGVVAGEEFLFQRRLIEIGIPEELRDHPVAQPDKVPGRAAGVPLLKDSDGVVIDEVTDIRGEHLQVRVRQKIVGEVGDVIPDVKILGNGAPLFDTVDERLIVRPAVGQRGEERVLDRAKTNHDVVARFDLGRGEPRVVVGECLDQNVGELRLNRLGHLVDKPDQRPGLGAVLLKELLALGALAPAAAVVLRYRDEPCFRRLPQGVERVADKLLFHLGVGQTQLTPFFPLAVDQRVPIGVLVEIFARRQNLLERMGPEENRHVPAVFGRYRVEVPVRLHSGREDSSLPTA